MLAAWSAIAAVPATVLLWVNGTFLVFVISLFRKDGDQHAMKGVFVGIVALVALAAMVAIAKG